ncbi:MAG TPA: arginine--tRNA ligase [Oscillospiraceae bacterium]|nr:arginine--tRNA ligase [Oscillospiraceae bacterium]HPF56527.1 arginine--tRNA ligase [Clostridiales bacterium]HPK34830.1 arginine--tRNA ligase [Oscillospiraceae bacterium]HPR76895.1 arginine--tRNA ligase [Oscillospiraceae bacterium]
MNDSVFLTAKQQADELVKTALYALTAEGTLPDCPAPRYTIEVPADRKNGDFAANAAMAGAKAYRLPPRKLAELLVGKFDFVNTFFARAEIAGPGFINFFLSDAFYAAAVNEVLSLSSKFGGTSFGGGKKVLIEFVSANPTGPAHMGNARGGALGDCLAAIMQTAGYEVGREFYVNDAGNQIAKFGLSLETRYLQLFEGEDKHPMPDDSYHGADIIEHAKSFAEQNGEKYVNADPAERKKALVAFALPKNVSYLRANMDKYRIRYDLWFYESSLYKMGEVERVIELLKNSGKTYTKNDALWFMVGDEPDCPDSDPNAEDEELPAEETSGETGKVFHKDFVLVRSNGYPTYIVPDIAYHYNKLVTRGFDLAIDVLGSDHHGYVKRLKQILPAVGVAEDRLEAILMQMVKLTRGGELVKMSKRTGNAITLTDLLDEIPTDAVRFLFNMRTPDSQMEFDLDLALEQTSQNPVYYTQYAHARICSIIKNLTAEGITHHEPTAAELALLITEEERNLIAFMTTLPSVVIDAAVTRDPSKVTRFAVSLATLFHKFYTECRVNTEDRALTNARLSLCLAVKTALCNILEMLKISTPESM